MAEPDRFQHYEVLRREDGRLWELGKGAMGITYKAFDTNLQRPVALKVINGALLKDETARQRFLREARAAAALRHPNVASVFHLGNEHGDYFYAMEFIDGQTVESYLGKKGHLEVEDALEIALQVSRALGAAEEQHLVHRDIKPANLMLLEDGDERVIKLIDFGLAKSVLRESSEAAMLTVSGGFVGTPHFASPEQLEEKDLDVRSDIYSLGVTLYYLLTGRPPFTGSIAQVTSQHLYKPVPMEPLAGLPEIVQQLLLRLLEKDRDHRIQTPQTLRQEILNCLEQVRAQKSGYIYRPDSPAVVDPLTTRALHASDSSRGLLRPGETLVERYQLTAVGSLEPEGQYFAAEDLRSSRQPVDLLILNARFRENPGEFTQLEEEVGKLQRSPHPVLLAIRSLESTPTYSFIVQEAKLGTSLMNILRSRQTLQAGEVVSLLKPLAQLADFARSNQLDHVDFSLNGVQVAPATNLAKFDPSWLKQPLDRWGEFSVKVSGIDYSFTGPAAASGQLADAVTMVQPILAAENRGSYLRRVALLSYELLGGQRRQIETTGRFAPLAGLSEEGNTVLRLGTVDEFSTAGELANALADAVAGRENLSKTPIAGSTRVYSYHQNPQQVLPLKTPSEATTSYGTRSTPTTVPAVSGGSTMPPAPPPPTGQKPPERLGLILTLIGLFVAFLFLLGIGLIWILVSPHPKPSPTPSPSIAHFSPSVVPTTTTATPSETSTPVVENTPVSPSKVVGQWIVDAAGGAGSNGSDLAAAIKRAADGDTIVLRSGNYSLGQQITKNLTISGESTTGEQPLIYNDRSEYNVFYVSQARVVLRNLKISQRASTNYDAVYVGSGGTVELENCVVTSTGNNGAEASGATLVIKKTTFDDASQKGGILCDANASCTIDSSTVANKKWALTARGGSKVTIRNTQFLSNGSGDPNGQGSTLDVEKQGSTLVVQNCDFRQNRAAIVCNGASLDILDSRFDGNGVPVRGPDFSYGLINVANNGAARLRNLVGTNNQQGIIVTEGADAQIDTCQFSNVGLGLDSIKNQHAVYCNAISVQGSGTKAEITNLTVENCGVMGIEASRGANVTAENCTIRGARDNGVGVGANENDGATVVLSNPKISGSKFVGVTCYAGSNLKITGGEITENATGVEVGANGQAVLDGVSVSRNASNGVLVFRRGNLSATNCAFRSNKWSVQAGLAKHNADFGGTIRLENCEVSQSSSYGAIADSGSHISLIQCRFTNNAKDYSALAGGTISR